MGMFKLHSYINQPICICYMHNHTLRFSALIRTLVLSSLRSLEVSTLYSHWLRNSKFFSHKSLLKAMLFEQYCHIAPLIKFVRWSLLYYKRLWRSKKLYTTDSNSWHRNALKLFLVSLSLFNLWIRKYTQLVNCLYSSL